MHHSTETGIWKVRWMWTVFACLVALAAGCASSGPPTAFGVGAEVRVSPDLNPDQSGRPSPLVLAIYQLKVADDFRNKDFFTVFDPSGAALGTDLLSREQITLQPGEDQNLEAEFDAQTQFVGIVGAFSDIENSQWRAFIELPPGDVKEREKIFKSQRLIVTVGEKTVAIALGG